MKLNLEDALRYLKKNMPTEKITDVYRGNESWSTFQNPLEELMRVNIGIHNDLVDKTYDEWSPVGYLHYPIIVDYIIKKNIPLNAREELPWLVYHELGKFAEPMIDIMKSSPQLRKTALQEMKTHLVYRALDAAGEMLLEGNPWNIRETDVLEPLESAIKLDYAIKKEVGLDET